jgi:hypothetical protein
MPKLPNMRLTSRRWMTGVAVAATLLAGGAAFAVPAGAAPAAPAVPVQGQCGNTQAAPTITVDKTTLDSAATTTVNITGTSYLLPPHVCGTQVFGGIYVFFGWVQPGPTWGPSHRATPGQGLFGQTYSYPGEGGGADTRDDGTGVVRLVSFTQGGESGAATDFHMDGAGNWSTSVVVNGSKYSFVNVITGEQRTVDCLQVQCGVFSIGAHGISSATNEVFTPINFTVAGGAPVVPPPAGAAGAGGGGAVATPGASGGGGDAGGGDAGDSGGGSTGDSGTSGAGGSSTTTTVAAAPGEVGSVGAGGDEATSTGAKDDEDAKQVVDSESAAAVQEFGESGGGGGSGVLIAVGVIVVLALVAGGVFFLRRRGATAAAGADR